MAKCLEFVDYFQGVCLLERELRPDVTSFQRNVLIYRAMANKVVYVPRWYLRNDQQLCMMYTGQEV